MYAVWHKFKPSKNSHEYCQGHEQRNSSL